MDISVQFHDFLYSVGSELHNESIFKVLNVGTRNQIIFSFSLEIYTD